MGLTDPTFQWLLILLAVAGMLATVLLWRRLARPSAVAVLGRIGSIIGINAIVILAAAVFLNNQFQFFISWADLTGSLATTVVTDHAGTSVSKALAENPAATPHGASRPDASSSLLPPDPTNQARQVQYDVAGTQSGISAPVVVILPKGYFNPANAHRRYPVIEAFPGYPGSAIGVPAHFQLATTNDALVSRHLMGPVLYVIPTTWVPDGRDTECVNGPAGTTQAETWVAQDVPAWVKAHFRVQQQRTGWSTFGMSAGGWCAAMTTFLHPDQFGAAIVLGGYFRPDWGNWTPFPDTDPAWARYDLVAHAASSPPPVAMYVFTSTGDNLSYPSTRALLGAAQAPLSITADVTSGGGHRLSEWTPIFGPSLQWLGKNIPGFAPIH